jgi:hypothetical protein
LENAKPPGWLDKENPYTDINIDQLPDWWRDAVIEFKAHDLPPYQPPRFSDDVLVPPILIGMETVFDIEIQLIGIDVDHDDTWGIHVGDEVIATVSRERTLSGHTRYDVTSRDFVEIVLSEKK